MGANLQKLSFFVSESVFYSPFLKHDFTQQQSIQYVGDTNAEITDRWQLLRYGSKLGPGIMGISPQMDALITKSWCNSTTIDCVSANTLVNTLEQMANNIVFGYTNMTAVEQVSNVAGMLTYAFAGGLKIVGIMSTYLAESQIKCNIPFSSLYIYIPCIILILIGTFYLHTKISGFLDVSHRIRCMLAVLPFEELESIPIVKEYIATFTVHETQTKGKKDSENRLAAAMEACYDAALVCTDKGIITEVNSSAKDLFGLEQSEFIGVHLSHLFEEKEEVNIALVDMVKLGGRFTREAQGKRKNGSLCPVRVSLGLTAFGKDNIVMCFCSDLTVESKQKELLKVEKRKYKLLIITLVRK
jgi:PAS domain S-box-containing protein